MLLVSRIWFSCYHGRKQGLTQRLASGLKKLGGEHISDWDACLCDCRNSICGHLRQLHLLVLLLHVLL